MFEEQNGLWVPEKVDTTNGSAGVRPEFSRIDHKHQINVQSIIPAGTIWETIAAVAPNGWALLDGTTIVNGQTLYPDLWAVIPASWKSGANILLVDGRGRTTIGSGTGTGLTARTLGASFIGAETHTLSDLESGIKNHSHGMAGHTHTINHDHAASDVIVPGTLGGTDKKLASDFIGGGALSVATPNTTAGLSVIGSYAYVDLPNFAGSSGGPSSANTDLSGAFSASNPHNNMQPSFVVNRMIKL